MIDNKKIINTNLNRLSQESYFYFSKQINNILYNNKCRITNLFNDYIYYDEIEEIMRRYYNRKESNVRLVNYTEQYNQIKLPYFCNLSKTKVNQILVKREHKHYKLQTQFISKKKKINCLKDNNDLWKNINEITEVIEEVNDKNMNNLKKINEIQDDEIEIDINGLSLDSSIHNIYINSSKNNLESNSVSNISYTLNYFNLNLSKISKKIVIKDNEKLNILESVKSIKIESNKKIKGNIKKQKTKRNLKNNTNKKIKKINLEKSKTRKTNKITHKNSKINWNIKNLKTLNSNKYNKNDDKNFYKINLDKYSINTKNNFFKFNKVKTDRIFNKKKNMNGLTNSLTAIIKSIINNNNGTRKNNQAKIIFKNPSMKFLNKQNFKKNLKKVTSKKKINKKIKKENINLIKSTNALNKKKIKTPLFLEKSNKFNLFNNRYTGLYSSEVINKIRKYNKKKILFSKSIFNSLKFNKI